MLNSPDPEQANGETEVNITDLDAPPMGNVPGSETWRGHGPMQHARLWMRIALLGGALLLVLLILLQVRHPFQPAARGGATLPAVHALPLSSFDGIAYASAPDGRVWAIRVRDGFLLWHHAGRGAVEALTTVADGVLFLALRAFENSATVMIVEALRANDGILLWSRTLPSDAPPPVSFTVVNKIIYLRAEVEQIEALRAGDGSVLWHATSRTPFVSTPSVADGVVFASTQDGHLDALRATDGFPLWQSAALIPPSSLPPVAVNGIVLVTLEDGSMQAFRTRTGALLWHYFPPSPLTGFRPLVAGGVVYVSELDGASALRASSGSLLWRAPLLFPIMLGSGAIYVEAQDGNLCALRVSSGSLLWCFKNGEGGAVSMTVIQGAIFLALQAGGIAALRASNGLLLWSYTPHVPTTPWSPLVVDGLVLITLQDGSMQALHANNGALLWHRTLDRS